MTESTKQSDFEVALLLLPWYAKDKLTVEVKSWVTQQLEKDADLREELNKIEKQISKTEDYLNNLDISEYENDPVRLSKLISRFTQQKSNEHNHHAKDKSIWNKIRSLIPKTNKAWQTAGAFALGVIVLQGVTISQLYQNKSQTDYSTLSEEQVSKQSSSQSDNQNTLSFLTRFHLNATVYDVDTLLTKYQLNITNGPDMAGIYKLVYMGEPLDADAIEKMITELEAKENIIRFIAQEN